MMPLGYDLQPIVNLNDTAELTATLYGPDDKPVAAGSLLGVSFMIQKPDASKIPVPGSIATDGHGYADFSGTDHVGHYVVVATFTDTSERVKSVRSDFSVVDPFEANPNLSASYLVATQIWSKVEDCFDTDDDLEGPFLRDATENIFNKEKMESFIDLALFDLNNLNPPTTLGIGNFVHTDPATAVVSSTADLPLLVQGGFIVCLRHLMTSYVEQPTPSGAQVGWLDRRDYLTRWTQIYTIEFAMYDRMAKLYKRRFLGLGTTKGILSSKAGRLIPAPMRTQFVGRGYW